MLHHDMEQAQGETRCDTAQDAAPCSRVLVVGAMPRCCSRGIFTPLLACKEGLGEVELLLGFLYFFYSFFFSSGGV